MLRFRVSQATSACIRRNGHALTYALSRENTLHAAKAAGVLLPRRFASSAAADDAKSSQELVYEGPMARAVRLMKGVSVTSCILTSIGMPTLCLISEQSTSMVGKWAMCGTIMLFGLGTTSLFHVLFKPYVMRMYLDKRASTTDPLVTVETLTLFARITKTQFQLNEVTRPANSMHPMISFRAKDKHFFIHPEIFEDEELLKKLMGDNFKVIKADKDEDDDE